MKKLVCLFGLIISFQFLSANSQRIASNIDAVTVFQQGAQITRMANVSVAAGTSTLSFYGLSQNMDPNSIILAGSGDIVVLSITHKNNFLTNDELSPLIKNLEKELEEIDNQLYTLEAERHGLIMEREVLEANRAIGGTQGVTADELRKATEQAKTIRERNANDWYRTEKEKKKLQTKKSKLQSQLNQERQVFAKRTGVVEVQVESKSTVNAKFSLQYIVHNASWSSSYDARVQELGKPINLIHKANIVQQTGEDWKNVSLTLSTGNPSASAQVPYMAVWYVNYSNVAVDKELKQKAVMNANTRFDNSGDNAEVSIGNQNFNLNQNLTHQEYSIDRKQTIVSTNSSFTVVLREMNLDAKYEYHAKPRLDPDAFLVAKVYNWAQYDLLDGELSLFNKNTYVGKSYLNSKVPTDTLQLSLGRDKGLLVKRARVYNKQEKTLLGNSRIEHYVWKIELRNNKKVPVKIVLRDQVPVSQHDDIKVSVNEVGGGKYDEKTGIIKWRLELEPNEKEVYTIGYEVKYPKDTGRQVMYY